MANVVDADLHLKALLGAGQRARHDARVQDQQVQPRQLVGDLGGKGLDVGQVGQVERLHGHLALRQPGESG